MHGHKDAPIFLDCPLSLQETPLFPAGIQEFSIQYLSNEFLWLSEPEAISVAYNQRTQKKIS